MDIQTYMEQHVDLGATFLVDAAALEIPSKRFHELAATWREDGGGDGFSFVQVVRHEQQSGDRRLAVVELMRDPA